MDADDKNRKNCTDASDVGASRKRALPELTRKEKNTAHQRCVGEDDGVRCPTQGAKQDAGHYLCGKHGGTNRCADKDCTERTIGMVAFCPSHKDTCKVEGCSKTKVYQTGYCTLHADLARAESKAEVQPWVDAKAREAAEKEAKKREKEAAKLEEAAARTRDETFEEPPTGGTGTWVDYKWPRPNTTEPVLKMTYVRAVRIDGKGAALMSGIYLDDEGDSS